MFKHKKNVTEIKTDNLSEINTRLKNIENLIIKQNENSRKKPLKIKDFYKLVDFIYKALKLYYYY